MNNAGILTFIALASVLLWFIISGKGRWWPKLLAILGVVGFSAILWFSALSFSGWPTHVSLPDKALFVSGYAVEPDDKQDGAIYVWLVAPPADSSIYEYQAKDGEPRAYVLEYSRDMHEQVQGASEATAAGKRVAFSSKGQPEGGQQVRAGGRRGDQQQAQGGNGNGNRPGNNRGGRTGTRGGQGGFYILPPSQLIPKEG